MTARALRRSTLEPKGPSAGRLTLTADRQGARPVAASTPSRRRPAGARGARSCPCPLRRRAPRGATARRRAAGPKQQRIEPVRSLVPRRRRVPRTLTPESLRPPVPLGRTSPRARIELSRTIRFAGGTTSHSRARPGRASLVPASSAARTTRSSRRTWSSTKSTDTPGMSALALSRLQVAAIRVVPSARTLPMRRQRRP